MVLIDRTRHSVSIDSDRRTTAVSPAAADRVRRVPHVARGAVISIHLVESGQSAALKRLAQLAEGPAPSGRALVAEVDGELWAALPLVSGKMLVDPFRPSSEVQQLLSLRAAQLRRDAA